MDDVVGEDSILFSANAIQMAMIHDYKLDPSADLKHLFDKCMSSVPSNSCDRAKDCEVTLLTTKTSRNGTITTKTSVRCFSHSLHKLWKFSLDEVSVRILVNSSYLTSWLRSIDNRCRSWKCRQSSCLTCA